MDSKQLKKIIAGLSIAGLLTGASFTLTGCPKPPPSDSTPGQSG